MPINFSPDELTRYARHLTIPDFGLAAQTKLKAAKVLVVGAGGLGSPVLLYLAAAGVGEIGIIDDDVVDLTNLQRQVLYTTQDIGKLKAECARQRLLAMNPHLKINIYPVRLTPENAMDIFPHYDVVADGTDNFPTRYLVNDACVIAGKINVYASIFRFEGQVSVFNYLDTNGQRGPNYRDLFAEPPPPGLIPSCAEGGVLGVLPGIIGSLQASEVIKVITGVGEPLAGRLFLFDAADFSTRILKIKKRADTSITELIDYQIFCGHIGDSEIPEISVEAFQFMKANQKAYQLIDVREAAEYAMDHMDGQLLPLSSINSAIASGPPIKLLSSFSSDQPIIVHCQSGQRSRQAIEQLKAVYPDYSFLNLIGGLNAIRKRLA